MTDHFPNNPYQREPLPPWGSEWDVRIPGVVLWDWFIVEDKAFYSKEWRYLLGEPDDPTLQTEVPRWWPLVHEDDVAPFIKAAQEVIKGRSTRFLNLFRIKRKDGQWLWLLSRGKVVEWRDNQPYRVRGALLDITYLRSHKKFLHGSRVPGGLESANNGPAADIAVHLDRDLSVLGTNPTLADRLKPRPLTPPSRIIIDDEAQIPLLLEKSVREVFTRGVPLRHEVGMPTEHGHEVWGQYSFWPEYDETGNLSKVLTHFLDLTEQKVAERQAELNQMRLNAQYRLIQMDNADEDEVLRYMAKALCELTDSERVVIFFPDSPGSVKGQVVWSDDHRTQLPEELLPHDQLPPDFTFIIKAEMRGLAQPIQNGNNLHPIRSLFDGRVPVYRHMIVEASNAEELVAVAYAYNKPSTYTGMDLQQVEAFLTTAWFILRRHKLVQELQWAKEAAEKANKVKDEFIAKVSHELRTPLNGILSMLKLLEFMPLADQQRNYVQMAIDSGQTLTHVIGDILDYGRIESGNMLLRGEAFDFGATARSCLDIFRKQAEQQGLTFQMDLSPDIPSRLLGDEARVRQVFNNIVGNALKFTEKGGVGVTCSLLPPRNTGTADIYICVRDTGVGIAEPHHDTIFDAFCQVDNPATRRHQGTGLGLSIVRHLVTLMNGTLTVESETGRGTAMHCSLRLGLAETAGEIRPEDEVDCSAVQSLDILVADDDSVARYAMKRFLERAGHRPVCVENGRQILEALMVHPFHCLFTDIRMDEMDGLEVVRRIRSGETADIHPSEEVRRLVREVIPGNPDAVRPVNRETITVTVSAHAMRGDRERFLSHGMDHYLSKPVSMDDLKAVLSRILSRLAGR